MPSKTVTSALVFGFGRHEWTSKKSDGIATVLISSFLHNISPAAASVVPYDSDYLVFVLCVFVRVCKRSLPTSEPMNSCTLYLGFFCHPHYMCACDILAHDGLDVNSRWHQLKKAEVTTAEPSFLFGAYPHFSTSVYEIFLLWRKHT